MIIIPELKTVVILVPRTGSGSLKKALLERYPGAMCLYRHMEADGVPHGYDRWDRVGVVRNPVDRLWSLFKFIKKMEGSPNGLGKWEAAYVERQRTSIERPFSEWIVENDLPFTGPYDCAGLGRFWPTYCVRHHLPENKKSQFVYLRPDLGTQIFQFSHLASLEQRLHIRLPRHNATEKADIPALSPAALDHISRFFQWDLVATATRLAA